MGRVGVIADRGISLVSHLTSARPGEWGRATADDPGLGPIKQDVARRGLIP